MALVNLDDINVHLPEDKLAALDADDDPSCIDAARIVKAKLSGTFSPTVLAGWTTPETTPEIIRAIAGRLVAALYYSRAFSAETTEAPEYAQNLYNEAMSMLMQIVTGDMVIPEVPDEDQPTTGGNLTDDDYTPNASSPAAMFTVSQVW